MLTADVSKPSFSSSSSTYLSQSTFTYNKSFQASRKCQERNSSLARICAFAIIGHYDGNQHMVLTWFFSKFLSCNRRGQNSPSLLSFFITCICTDRGNTLYVEPFASTGLKKAMSTSYSLFSDLPVNLSVSSARTMDASFTSVCSIK